jgi:hypothetical protein
MGTLKFSQWESKYYSVEESIETDVYNWLSKNFGGRISKIDGLISDLVREEKNYAKEWESTQHEISSMKDQIKSGEISSEEDEDFRTKIRQKEEQMKVLNRKRIQKIRSLSDEAETIVEGNPRLSKYWNVKKAEAELAIAENLYRISKSLPDQKIEDQFYKSYKEAQERLTLKRKGIESISKEIKEKPVQKKEKITKKLDVDLDDIIYMNIYDFKNEISDYTPYQIKELKKELVNKKNEALNYNRYLQREKRKELDNSSSSEKGVIYSKYNPKISEIGETIDRIRQKIRHLDE